MKSLKCIVGIHKLFYPQHSVSGKDLPQRRCTLCGIKSEATYDMSNGDTIWTELSI